MTHIERVARAYLDAPRRSDLPATAAAYAQLTDQCGRWYDHLTSRARQPVRVVFTRCRAPYATGAEWPPPSGTTAARAVPDALRP